MRKFKKIELLGIFILLLFPGIVWAEEVEPGTNDTGAPITDVLLGSIVPQVKETGKISLSIDGLGVYPGYTGNIQVEKPVGATVRKAYFAAATTGFKNYKLAPGDIQIAGNNVIWDIETPSSISSWNYWADVTSIIKPIIDGSSPGRVDVSITENSAMSYNIDGEILAVIFDDPNQAIDTEVIILFGAQHVLGDTFHIGLVNPIDKSDPNLGLDLSLGISYGHQPGGQRSIIDVNGIRMTSSAGGEDDGSPANGALLTVGGLDDDNTNPDPNALPVNPRTDDELYNILPFVSNGDTTINVYTVNPSNDDNIFFGALLLKSASGIVNTDILLKIRKEMNRQLYEEPYLYNPDDFDTAVGAIWINIDGVADDYDAYYTEGMIYRGLRMTSLVHAKRYAEKGNVEKAEDYLNSTRNYEINAATSYENARNVYISSLTHGTFVFKEIRDLSQFAFKAGVSSIYPPAGQILDYGFMAVNYEIDKNIFDKGDVQKELITKLVFKGIFTMKVPALGDISIEQYLSSPEVGNSAGNFLFPKIQDALKDPRSQEAILDLIVSAIPDISEEGAVYLSNRIVEMGPIKYDNNYEMSKIHSPGELRMYDSQGRVTGLVNGHVKEEIPNSIYDIESKSVMILLATDTYRYEVIGTDTGEYGLDILSVRGTKHNKISLTKVPILPNVVHQYTADWNNFPEEKMITLNVDSNNDGTFDENVNVQLPKALFTYSYLTNQNIIFDASPSWNNIVSYKWDLGDGTTANEKTVDHTYPEGDYAVTLTVENANGGIDSRTRNIRIDLAPPITTATISGILGDNGWYKPGVQVSLSATDSVGINKIEYSFDNINWNKYITDFNIDTQGEVILYYHSIDNVGNIEPVNSEIIKIEKTDIASPQITINVPSNEGEYFLNQEILADWSAIDLESGIASITGTKQNGEAIDTATVGTKTFTVDAVDNAGNSVTKTVSYHVSYNFAGFFRPINNLPMWNSVKSGRAVPLKFSLGGDQGLDIFATGYPASEEVNCDSDAVIVGIDETVTAGSSSLSYNATLDQYSYVWKTDKAWAGSCRRLVILLKDGTYHNANFKFFK